MTDIESPAMPPRRGRPPRVREAEVRPEAAREQPKKQRTRRGSGTDPLNIPKNILEGLWEEGFDLQWNTESVLGQPAIVEQTQMAQQGWEEVTVGMFDGRLDYLAPKGHKGQIIYQGLRLDWRPRELTEEARAEDDHNAKTAVRAEEAKLRGGNLDGVSLDTAHPTARAKTYINKERVPTMPIPR